MGESIFVPCKGTIIRHCQDFVDPLQGTAYLIVMKPRVTQVTAVTRDLRDSAQPWADIFCAFSASSKRSAHRYPNLISLEREVVECSEQLEARSLARLSLLETLSCLKLGQLFCTYHF